MSSALRSCDGLSQVWRCRLAVEQATHLSGSIATRFDPTECVFDFDGEALVVGVTGDVAAGAARPSEAVLTDPFRLQLRSCWDALSCRIYEPASDIAYKRPDVA